MKRVFFYASLALAILAPAWPASAAPLPVKNPDPRLQTLDLLHCGRFDEAEAVLDEHRPPGAGDVHHAFLRAFVTYWRLLYDGDDPALREEFERRLGRTIALGSRDLRRRPGDPEIALWKGSAHLLLAQLRAAQKKPFGAAFEAKKARKLLEKSVSLSPAGSADSAFGLGTYQYYADQVPAIVKGLRVLLFIPGGNREKGLERLSLAADRSPHFGLEARLLLATIHSSSHEENFGEALEQARRAALDHPEAVAAHHGAAKLEIDLFRSRDALARLEKVFRIIDAHPRTDRAVVATLSYHAARAEFALFRPDRALHRLEPVLEASESLPPGLLEDLRRDASLYAALAGDRSRPREPAGEIDLAERRRIRLAAGSLRAARDALEEERLGNLAGSSASLVELSASNRQDAVLSLLAGRALLLQGRSSEALPYLEGAERSGNLPGPWRGPACLMAGQAADLAGQRPRALGWYTRAVEQGHFPGRDAATLHRTVPYTGV